MDSVGLVQLTPNSNEAQMLRSGFRGDPAILLKDTQIKQAAMDGLAYCFSRRASSKLAAKFGENGQPAACIRFKDMAVFVERLETWVRQAFPAAIASRFSPCVYRHSGLSFLVRYEEDHPAFTKSFQYAEEAEVRLYLPSEGQLPPFMQFSLGRLDDICEQVGHASLDKIGSRTVAHPGRDKTGVIRRLLIDNDGVRWESSSHEQRLPVRRFKVRRPKRH